MSDKEEIEILEEEIRLQELRLKKEKLDQEERDFYRNKELRTYYAWIKAIIIVGIIFGILIFLGWLSVREEREIRGLTFNKKSPEISKSIPGLS